MTADNVDGRLVVGLQPVREAIRAHGNRLTCVLVDDRDLPRLDAIERFARDQGVVRVERCPRFELERLSEGVMHQGVVAFAPPLKLHAIEGLLENPALLAVALDGIQDPQNFGAVVRSAVAIADAPIVWGAHSSAPLTPATFRASAGAIEHATLVRVSSLRQTLLDAQGAGVQVIGLDAQAPQALHELDLVQPTILVIGNEHEGMNRGVRRACTVHARLCGSGRIDSLNASVASGIALHTVLVSRMISKG